MGLCKKAAGLIIAMAACMVLLTVVVSADSGLVRANGGLNLRTGPGLENDIICVIPNGTVITVDGTENGWLKATYNGSNGYVSAQYVTVRQDYTDRSGYDIDRTSLAKGQEVVEFAKNFLGTRYCWGGSSPETGFDCSGFTSYVYKQFGYSINRTSETQIYNGISVGKDELMPGDLVIFSNSFSTYGHVGIYVGDGMFIHSVKTGTPVSINSLTTGSFARNFQCARRIIY